MTPQNNFDLPSRQSPIAILLFLVKFLRITVKQAWPLAIVMITTFRKLDFTAWYVSATVILIACLYIFFSIYSYLRFYYSLSNGEIIIKKGIFTRTTINLPFEKIQTIDFKQNILQQIFGVVEISIDSAGSKKQEVNLSAIKLAKAETLREFILDKKKQIKQVEKEEFELEEKPKKESVILRLGFLDLLKVGITQNHIKSLGLMVVFGGGLIDQIRKITEETKIADTDLETAVNNYFESTVVVWLWVILFVLVVIVPFLISIFTTIFRYFDLKLSLNADGIKLQNGLLNKKQKSTTLSKVQTIKWGYNPIQKLFNFFTIKIYPATATAIKAKNALTIPGTNQNHVEAVLEALEFDQNSRGLKEYRFSKLYYVRAFWMLGLLPALILGLILYYFFDFHALWVLPWPLLIFLESYVEYKKWRLFLNEEVVKIRYGLFGLHHKIFYWHKIQAIKIKRSPFQKRNNLSDVVFYQAGHQVTLPYLDFELARQIQKYAAYKVETDKRGWM